MLDAFDDYLIHQTSNPVAHPVTGDRNFYDRYFFNGYTADASVYFAVALGLYPNRQVMDAAFSVLVDGVQTSVHASRRAPSDRGETRVGPVTVEVVEPMRILRVRVEPNDAGLEADLTFQARSVAIEEPGFFRRSGVRTYMDYTRLTQFGAWDGRIVHDGQQLVLGPGTLGSRDRSWGVRPVGEREVQPPGPLPQFFWLWSPLNFDDVCVHFDAQEDGEGRRWHGFGAIVPVLGAEDPPLGRGDTLDVAERVEHRVRWRAGTRRAEHAEIVLHPVDGPTRTVELAPVVDFQMLGIGYLHPEWGHGVWKGEEEVGVERWRVAELDPLAPGHIHVQQLCRARFEDREGMGVLEQLVIGPHAPSGFAELLDGARG
jgi:hypothetical protein